MAVTETARTAEHLRPEGRIRTRSVRTAVTMVAALALAAVALRVAASAGIPQVQNFFLVFESVLIEAFPFVVLGAAVSALIEVWVPAAAFTRLARLPGPLQLPLAGLGGFAFPVCECGSVPVARRLAVKGLPPGAAVTFMLAAPILNPVVLISTAIAFRGRDVMWVMVGMRAALGLAAAVAVGWIVAGRPSSNLLRAGTGRAGDPHHEGRWPAFVDHLSGDVFSLGGYLIIGAAVAAALQTFVPQSVLGSVARTPVLSIVALMALAVVLSLCSESDAFVAASFVQFGPAAQLAFLVLGPIFDAKLAFLYAGTFGRRFTLTVAVVAPAVTLVGALWLGVLIG